MHKVIVALDFDSETEALALVDALNPELCRLKVGAVMFTRFGPPLVRLLVERGFGVFLDLKFHDIPATVAAATLAAAELGIWMLNVHASGGMPMLRAASNAMANFALGERPLLTAVTLLTSDNSGHDRRQEILQLAEDAKSAGLDGVVCSAHEARMIKSLCGEDFVIVSPGIRRQEDSCHDQSRIMTPQDARAEGCDYIVVGRPITRASEPLQVLQEFITKFG